MALIELLVVLAAGMQFQVCRLRIFTSKTLCFIVGNVCICFKNEKKNWNNSQGFGVILTSSV